MTRTDSYGLEIGNGSYHVQHNVIDLTNYPQVAVTVNYSGSTESVYVVYTNMLTLQSTTVRFSNHMCNAVLDGDQLDGAVATDMQILYRIGLATRTFAPATQLVIRTTQIKKALLVNLTECPFTLPELYAMGEGADISAFVGMYAKGTNRVINSSTVVREQQVIIDRYGNEKVLGKFTYAAL